MNDLHAIANRIERSAPHLSTPDWQRLAAETVTGMRRMADDPNGPRIVDLLAWHGDLSKLIGAHRWVGLGYTDVELILSAAQDDINLLLENAGRGLVVA